MEALLDLVVPNLYQEVVTPGDDVGLVAPVVVHAIDAILMPDE